MKKLQILEWYCREGWCGEDPDCDTHCPGGKGTNPCFNYRILAEMLGVLPEVWFCKSDVFKGLRFKRCSTFNSCLSCYLRPSSRRFCKHYSVCRKITNYHNGNWVKENVK